MPSPGWTAADQAELDIILYEYIDLQAAHLYWCPTCIERDYCQTIRDTWAAVEEWRLKRRLLSKATFYRLEELVDQALERKRPGTDPEPLAENATKW